ncbi:hypothetical protein, partial [Salmonella sp. SAL4448]|uniref:hypothetical protein n=1 Tax=Salmonella sp. SAL4448 TaxID=3159903 RepID=UPI0039780E77
TPPTAGPHHQLCGRAGRGPQGHVQLLRRTLLASLAASGISPAGSNPIVAQTDAVMATPSAQGDEE